MRIRLHSFYQNVTGVKIPMGEYEDGDPLLFGLANYLVDNGHATIIESVTVDVSIKPEGELPKPPKAKK